jgi:hypothetical protein
MAARNGLPLITMEGWSPDGYRTDRSDQIPAKAAAKRVIAVRPEDFYCKKLDEEREIKRFFKRFEVNLPDYLSGRENIEDAQKSMKVVWDYYHRLASRDWT